MISRRNQHGSVILPRSPTLRLILLLMSLLAVSYNTSVVSSSSPVRTKATPGWFRRTTTNTTTTETRNDKNNNDKQKRIKKSKQRKKNDPTSTEIEASPTNPSKTKKDNVPWDPITSLLNAFVSGTSQRDDKNKKQKQQPTTKPSKETTVSSESTIEESTTTSSFKTKRPFFRFFSSPESDINTKERQSKNDLKNDDNRNPTDASDTSTDFVETDKEQQSANTTVSENHSQSTNVTSSEFSSNTTVVDESATNETDITVQQQLPGNMIILNGPPPPNRRQFPSQHQGTILLSPGGMPPALFLSPQQQQQLQQQQQRQLQQQQQQQQQMQQNTVVFIDLLASIIGTAMRLWFLTWITRFLASQEQYITPTQHFVYEQLNDRYERDTAALKTVLDRGPSYMKLHQWRKYQRKYQTQSVPNHRNKKKYPPNPSISMTSPSPLADIDGSTFDTTVLVVELRSDSKGEIDIPYFTDLVNFITMQYKMYAFGMNKTYPYYPLNVEVVLLVQSPGGSVATYGLAAAQIQRLQRCSIDIPQPQQQQQQQQEIDGSNSDDKGVLVAGNTTDTTTVTNPKIKVTVCVDKYAASGGYMMASQADYLIAAPFATVGSVGVIMEGLNFHEIATRYGVTPLVLKAGTSKNPITTWGPVTQNELDSESERLGKVHLAFQDFVLNGRPVLRQQADDADDATIKSNLLDGSVYIGYEAKELKFVDDIMTSDEYILSKITAGNRVLKIHKSSDYSDRGRSLRNISPIDILPHLLKWGSNSIQSVLSGGDQQQTNQPEPQQQAGSSNKLLRYGILASIGLHPFLSNILAPILRGKVFSFGQRRQSSFSESTYDFYTSDGSIKNSPYESETNNIGQRIIQKLVRGVVYATFVYNLLHRSRN